MPASEDPWPAALRKVWEKQSSWSQKADQLKRVRTTLAGPLLVASFVGAFLGVLSPSLDASAQQQGWHWALVLVPVVLVSSSAYLTKELLGPKQDEEWMLARTISEQLKSEGYIYAAAAPPYAEPGAAPARLVERVAQLEKSGGGLLPLPASAAEPAKRPQGMLSADDYIAQRLKGPSGQISWFEGEARRNNGLLNRYRNAGIGLGLVSVLIGAVGAAVHANLNSWLAMVTTAVATLNAFVFSRRFEFLVSSYAGTANALGNLIDRRMVSKDRSKDSEDRFVLDCEAAIAAQHKSWVDQFSKRVVDALNAPVKPASG